MDFDKLDYLDERQKRILLLRQKGMSFDEIALGEKITKQRAYQILDSAIRSIEREDKNPAVQAMFSRISRSNVSDKAFKLGKQNKGFKKPRQKKYPKMVYVEESTWKRLYSKSYTETLRQGRRVSISELTRKAIEKFLDGGQD